MAKILVTKYDGSRQAYDRKKLLGSLVRCQVPEKEAEKIVSEVEEKLFDGISTNQIYEIIYSHLLEHGRKKHYQAYRLRETLALIDSFVFERFVQRLLGNQGFTSLWNRILKGKCSTHQIDVLAEKEGKKFLVEVKHHQNPHRDSGLTQVLALRGRLEDLEDAGQKFTGWLFTNTKLSRHAKIYASCRGIKLTGWRYGGGGVLSLEKMIEKVGEEEVDRLIRGALKI